MNDLVVPLTIRFCCGAAAPQVLLRTIRRPHRLQQPPLAREHTNAGPFAPRRTEKAPTTPTRRTEDRTADRCDTAQRPTMRNARRSNSRAARGRPPTATHRYNTSHRDRRRAHGTSSPCGATHQVLFVCETGDAALTTLGSAARRPTNGRPDHNTRVAVAAATRVRTPLARTTAEVAPTTYAARLVAAPRDRRHLRLPQLAARSSDRRGRFVQSPPQARHRRGPRA